MSTLLKTASCDVHIGKDCFDQLSTLLSGEYKKSRKIFLVDSNTRVHCLPLVLASLPADLDYDVIEVPFGEESKSLSSCEKIWSQLTASNADKKSVLINTGGGMIGDLGGFVASTFLRGIDFVQVPTSLLAMVDASYGGKTGINFGELKNQVGTFSSPTAIYIYPPFLDTLPRREFNSGLAEIIKHALIADAALWAICPENQMLDSLDIIELIKRSIEIKSKYVAIDPKDKNERHALNFGHTIGHAIESYSLIHHKDPYLHGEAIAIGMIAETFLSHQHKGLSVAQTEEIVTTLLGLYNYLSFNIEPEKLMTYIRADKKNKNSVPNFSLLPLIGSVTINQVASEDDILNSLQLTLRQFLNSVV